MRGGVGVGVRMKREVGVEGGGGSGAMEKSMRVCWFIGVCEGFYTMSFESNRASSRHLGSMNTSVYYARACDPGVRDIDQVKLTMCMDTWIQMFVFAPANKSIPSFSLPPGCPINNRYRSEKGKQNRNEPASKNCYLQD